MQSLFLGPLGPLRVPMPVHPSTRPQSFYLSHLQRHRHKRTATKAPPLRAPPTKIPQTIFRQESFVSLKFEVWIISRTCLDSLVLFFWQCQHFGNLWYPNPSVTVIMIAHKAAAHQPNIPWTKAVELIPSEKYHTGHWLLPTSKKCPLL